MKNLISECLHIVISEAKFFEGLKFGQSILYFHRNNKSHAPETKIFPMQRLFHLSK